MFYDTASLSALADSASVDNSGFAQNALAVAVGSVVDMGTSMYNSIGGLFGADQASTYNVMQQLGGNDFGNAYLRNQGLIHTLSFIGGMLIPGGAAIKLSKIAREGLAGTSFLGNALSHASLAKNVEHMAALAQDGKRATAEYRRMRNATMIKGIAQGAVDNAAAEVAVVGTMNAHPFMEGYMDDLPANFASSLALGTGIGALVDTAATAYRVRKAVGGALESSYQPVLNKMYVSTNSDSLINFQTSRQSERELTNILSTESMPTETKRLASSVLQSTREATDKHLFDTVHPDVAKQFQDAGNEAVDTLRDTLDNPNLIGANRIEFFNPDSASGEHHPVRSIMGSIINTVRDPNTGKVSDSFANAVLVPARNGRKPIVINPNSAAGVARAADKHDVASINREAKNTFSRLSSMNDTKVADIIYNGRAVDADSAYLSKLIAVNKMSVTGRPLTINARDLPTQQALLQKANVLRQQLDDLNEQRLDPKLTPSARSSIEKQIAFTQKALDTKVHVNTGSDNIATSTILTPRLAKALHIAPNHMKTVARHLSKERNISSFQDIDAVATRHIKAAMTDTTQLARLRNAMVAYRNNPETAPAWVTSIMNSTLRQQQLADLRHFADKEGYLYLMKENGVGAAGRNGVNLMTTDASRASDRYAYRISVDNVIGAEDGHILVFDPPARSIDNGRKFQRLEVNPTTNEFFTQHPSVTLGSINSMVRGSTLQAARSMLSEGMAPEEVATRTNLTEDSVDSILGSAGNSAPIEFRYTQATDDAVKGYLAPTNRMLQVSATDKRRSDLPTFKKFSDQWKGGMNQQQLDDWNKEATIGMLQSSNSDMIKRYLAQLGLDFTASDEAGFRAEQRMISAQLGKINDGFAGNRFITSSDMYSRMMGDAGTLINRAGERMSRVANAVTEDYVGRANSALSKIADDPAQLLMHNTILQAIRSSDKKIRINHGMRLMEEYHGRNPATGEEVWKPLNYQGRDVNIPESQMEIWQAYADIGDELHELMTTKSKIVGKAPPSHKGLWVPSFNPTNRFVAFVRRSSTDDAGTVKNYDSVLVARNAEELNAQREAVKAKYSGSNDKLSFLLPNERNARDRMNYDRLHDAAVRGQITRADVADLKLGKGSTEAPSATLGDIREILAGYSSRLYMEMQDVQGLLYSDSLAKLDVLRENATRLTEDQAMTPYQKFLHQGVDSATAMKSSLLGRNDLQNSYVPARWANDAFSAGIEMAAKAMSSVTNAVVGEGNFLRKEKGKAKLTEKWDKIEKEMDAAGLPYPFKGLDAQDIERQFGNDTSDVNARRIVSAGNAFAGTMALRFAELAQPIVNLLSMPIMTQSAVNNVPATFQGAAREGTTRFFDSARHLFNGAALTNNPSPFMGALMQQAERDGVFQPIVSEATNVIKLSRLRERGAVAKFENFVEGMDKVGRFGKMTRSLFTGASDWSETMTRRIAFGAGVSVASSRYGLKLSNPADARRIYTFAREFVDSSIGNYTAHQRPVMFHGTLGAAAGLFQTYMVTLGQNLYKHIEIKDAKALAQVAGWQSSLFGFSSLPGYNELSQYIGSQYNSDHADLISGMFENLPDPIANIMTYGLPSSIGSLWGSDQVGPNFTTRGAVDFRVGIPAAQMITESATSIAKVLGQMGSVSQIGSQGMLEAMQVQSISRPLARLSELVSGYSVTQSGHTVQTPEEVYTPLGILSRMLAVRTTQEWKLRSAMHLQSFYGAQDYENRQEAMGVVRSAIRNDNLTNDVLYNAFDNYLQKGGTADGFRSALNNAIGFEEFGGGYKLGTKLDPNDPLLSMINTMQ